MLDSVFEVPTEEEHWAMSEEVSISLHTEEEISYTGMNGLKKFYVQVYIVIYLKKKKRQQNTISCPVQIASLS